MNAEPTLMPSESQPGQGASRTWFPPRDHRDFDPATAADQFRRELEFFRNGLELVELESRFLESLPQDDRMTDSFKRQIARLWLDRRPIEEWRRHIPLGATRATSEDLGEFWNTWQLNLAAAIGKLQRLKDSPSRPVLAAFSLVNDHIIYLLEGILEKVADELATAATDPRWGLKHSTPLDVRRDAQKLSLDRVKELSRAVKTPLDVLALLYSLMLRPGLKPKVDNSELRQWLQEFVQQIEAQARRLGANGIERRLGGAAGNEAWILDFLGLSCWVSSPYVSCAVSELAPERARWVHFGNGRREWPGLQRGEWSDPCRVGYAFQITPELIDGKWGPRLDDYKPERSDRTILRLGEFVSPNRWQQLNVVWANSHAAISVRVQSPVEGGETSWPLLPVFQHRYQFSEGLLEIRLASEEDMRQLTGVGGVLVGGFDGLAKDAFLRSRDLATLLRQVFTRQLRVLADKRVPLFWELSGADDPESLQRLADLAEAAGIRAIGSNREELVQVTSQPGSPYFVAPAAIHTEGAFNVFWRALRFLGWETFPSHTFQHVHGRFDFVETHYIHDAELDVMVLRNRLGTESDRVVAWLEKASQSMLLAKAVVPEALVARSGHQDVHHHWDCRLSNESLLAVKSFAVRFAAYAEGLLIEAGARSPKSEDEKENQEREIEAVLAMTGAYHHPALPFSVAIAPAISVDFEPCVTTTGAGDMNVAVVVQLLGELP